MTCGISIILKHTGIFNILNYFVTNWHASDYKIGQFNNDFHAAIVETRIMLTDMASPKIYASANLLLNNTNSHGKVDGHVDDHVEDESINPLAQCGLCIEVYDDPRVLPCSHTFCLDCLQKQVHNNVIISSLDY